MLVTIEGYFSDNRTSVNSIICNHNQNHQQRHRPKQQLTQTEAPTEVPTEAPTEAATDTPTESQTEAPTEVPTEAPTEAATEETIEETNEGISSIPITATAAASKDERKYKEKLKKVWEDDKTDYYTEDLTTLHITPIRMQTSMRTITSKEDSMKLEVII